MVGYLHAGIASDLIESSLRSWNWVLDGGVFQVHVCWLKPVNRNNIWLPSSVGLEGLEARLYCFVGSFVGILEGRAMSVTKYQHKFGLLQIPRHIGWHCTML